VTLQIAEGAIQIDGAGKNASAIADEVLARIREEAPATLLLSAMEQFVSEQGA
jgi:hypothetical protein